MLDSLRPAFLIASVVISLTAWATPAFDVEGEISYTGTLSNHITKSFHVAGQGCQWSITTWKAETEQPTTASVVCDGTNVYRVIRFGKGPQTRIGRGEDGKLKVFPPEPARTVAAKNQGAVRVVPGQIPEFDASFAAPLWLIFASGCVLDAKGTNGVLKPMWATGPQQDSAAAYAEWERHPEPPHFPTNIKFRTQADSPYKAVLQTSSFQKDNGFTYPASARLIQFATHPRASRNSTPLTVTDVRVYKFSVTERFVPAAIPTNSTVTDLRLRLTSTNEPAEFYGYLTTNGTIADPAKVTNTTPYKLQAALRRRLPASNHPAVRHVVLAVLAVTSLLFAAYLLKRRHNQQVE